MQPRHDPSLQNSSQSIDLSTSYCAINTSNKRFDIELGASMEYITSLAKFTITGEKFVHMLYTFRSLSRVIPMAPSDASDELNEKILLVMDPEMDKLKEMIEFINNFISVLKHCILFITDSQDTTNVNESVYDAFIAALDLIIKLDFLKDAKSSLINDFTRFKRLKLLLAKTKGPDIMVAINQELEKLQLFLSNPDPSKAKNYIYLTLRNDIKRIPNHEKALISLLEYALDCSMKDLFMTPDEKHRTLRVIPILMLLIDGGYGNDSNDIPIDSRLSVFKSKAINITELQQLFKHYPVLPLYADINITVVNIFDRSVHFKISDMGNQWGGAVKEKVEFAHSVTKHWPDIKETYDEFSCQFVLIQHQMNKNKLLKSVDPTLPMRAKEIYNLISNGLHYISHWNGILCRVMAWKFTHPASIDRLKELNANMDSSGLEYERLIKYNFTKMEVSMFSDIVSMIKSTAANLDKLKADIAPIVRFHIHHEIQQLVQGNLLPILHRMDKRKSSGYDALYRLRTLNADWLNNIEPSDDIKEYSSKLGVPLQILHPVRVVGPDYNQLQMLRTEMRALYHTKSIARQKVGFFGKADLKKEDIEALENFYSQSYFYPYMLNFENTLKEVSDLSYLWYRELYLDATKSIQFTIDMSLPWLLTEHVIQNQRSMIPVIENMFYTLDIYNDAAYRALYVLHQQHLYDEIEAEMNLVFDQFVIQLAEGVYSNYKDISAYSKLDNDYKQFMEQSEVLKALTFAKNRLEIPVSQRKVHILGRSVDLNQLVCIQINNWIQEDISYALSKLESQSMVGMIEYCLLINIIRSTHHEISKCMSLDPFDTIMNEINGSMNPKTTMSVLNAHMVTCLSKDLLPNYVYNAFTDRFVECGLVLRPFTCEKAPKLLSRGIGYGRLCHKSFENYSKMTMDCFTKYHLELLMNLPETYCNTVPFIVNSCLSFMYTSLQELQRYNKQLKESIPCIDILSTNLEYSEDIFVYIQQKLKSLLTFTQLKAEVFQIFKEIGNTFSFVRMLSETMEVKDQNIGEVCLFLNNENINLQEAFSSVQLLANSMSLSTSNGPYIGERVSTIIKDIVDDGKTRSILQYFVSRIMGFLQVLGLESEWKDVEGIEELSQKNSNSLPTTSKYLPYHRIWSAFLFLYIDEDISKDTPSDIIAVNNDNQEVTRIMNEDEFGHGFIIGGSLLLHLMNQQEKFNLYDLTSILLTSNNCQMHIKESMNTLKEIAAKPKKMAIFGGGSGSGGGNKKNDTIDDGTVGSKNDHPDIIQKRDDFVLRSTFCKLVMSNTIDLLGGCYVVDKGSTTNSTDTNSSAESITSSGDDKNDVVFFHPPTKVVEDCF